MNVLIFLFIAVMLAAFSYWLLLKNTEKQLNMTLEIDPTEVERGKSVKVIVRIKPSVKITLISLDGFIMAKKFVGYKGSWADKSDLPWISNGIILTRTDFSFGKNITLNVNDESKHTGIIPIPENAVTTEVRHLMHTRWFITVKAKIASYLPPITLIEELFVLRPLIVGDEKLTMEEESEQMAVYDPMYDIHAPEKMVKVLVTSVINPAGSVEEPKKSLYIEEEEVSKPAVEVASHTRGGGIAGRGKYKPEPQPEPKIEKPAKPSFETIAYGHAKDFREEPLHTETKARLREKETPKPTEEAGKDLSDRLKPTYQAPYDPTRAIRQELEKQESRDQSPAEADVLLKKPARTGPSYHREDYSTVEFKTPEKTKEGKPPEKQPVRPAISKDYQTRYEFTTKAPRAPLRRKDELDEKEADDTSKPSISRARKRDKFSGIDKYSKK